MNWKQPIIIYGTYIPGHCSIKRSVQNTLKNVHISPKVCQKVFLLTMLTFIPMEDTFSLFKDALCSRWIYKQFVQQVAPFLPFPGFCVVLAFAEN